MPSYHASFLLDKLPVPDLSSADITSVPSLSPSKQVFFKCTASDLFPVRPNLSGRHIYWSL
jgi:hypothetical protein